MFLFHYTDYYYYYSFSAFLQDTYNYIYEKNVFWGTLWYHHHPI